MTTIHITTHIKAPIHKVFDLSRNIDFHQASAKKTKEKAIDGKTTGLIGPNETVTWRGKHFGCYLTHQSLITSFNSPYHFTDEMINGNFKYFKHQHIFHSEDYGTKMIDILTYDTPYGILGKIFDKAVLKKHLIQFLNNRNTLIKEHLEIKEKKKILYLNVSVRF